VFDAFDHWLHVSPAQAEDEAGVFALDRAAVMALTALIRLGGFDDREMEDQILGFLRRMLRFGSTHVQEEVREALRAFLRENPHRINTFISGSTTEAQRNGLQRTAMYRFPAPTTPAKAGRSSCMLGGLQQKPSNQRSSGHACTNHRTTRRP
jgi:hypothetical protein